jgi:ATP-binding cassette subfamily C protein LapB
MMALSESNVLSLHRGKTESHADELLECLLWLARHHDRPAASATALAGLPLDEQGRLTPETFARAAVRLGLHATTVKLPIEQLDATGGPLVLYCKDLQAFVFLGWSDDGQFATLVGAELSGVEVQFPREQLTERYTGYAVRVQPEFWFAERSASAARPQAEKHWFWGALSRQVSSYREVAFAALLINAFALAMPLFTMNVYDRVVPNRAMETLWMLALGIAMVLGFDFALRTARARLLDIASRRVDTHLSAYIMERVLGTRLEHRPASVGSFADNLRSFESVRDFVTSATFTAVVDLPFSMLFLLAMAWISPWMVLPVLAGVAVAVLLAFPIQARMRELSQSMHHGSAQRNAALIEGLASLETIKALAAEGWLQRRWEQAVGFLADTGIRLRALGTRAVNTVAWTQQMVSVVLVVLGVHLIAANDLTMGGLIACTMLAGRAMSPLGQLAALITQFHNARSALGSLDGVVSKPQERPVGQRFIDRGALKGAIEFRNVAFRYPGQQSDALQAATFRIEAGEKVAVLGRTGSGKSTILRLAMGLYQPTDGTVLVDGIDLRQLDPAQMRRQVGYVPQESVLLRGSLRDNIVLGADTVSDAQVIEAATIADLIEYVNRHPRGFDLPVGERGEGLSGGQRKAVVLARAVVGNRPILLMDEPTDAMDHTTEERVRQSLGVFLSGRTAVIVTHRTALLELVDKVIVVDQGRIVAAGPREQVLGALRAGRVGRGA